MGVVHLARRPGGDRVALKVLRPHIVGDDEARARLAREVSSLSRIRSRWVAEIVDADPWGEVPYVATRYVPGLSLHDHVVDEGPITGADLTWFAGCLAEGLASVHRVGVLHRDVKPSNVLMEGRTPILIDFGLARVADDPKLTHTGWLLGTPGYLAPEILYGDDATSASDVHSWAATVAYAGTGRPPFGRGPSMAIMDRVRRGEHELSGLPARLRGIIEAALDPDPARRPGVDDLLRWLRPDPSGPTAAPVPPVPAADDPYTIPLAIAAQAPAAAPTDHLPRETFAGPGPPRTLARAPAARSPARHRCCGRRCRDRGVPLAGVPVPAPCHLAAAQRLARRERRGRPAASARSQVVRRHAVPPGRALAPGPVHRRHGGADAVEPRPGRGGGADLLRRRRRPDDHAGRGGHGVRDLAVARAGRLPGPRAAVPGGQPGLRLGATLGGGRLPP